MTSCNFPVGASQCSLPCDPQGHYQHRCAHHQTDIDEIFNRHRQPGQITGKYRNTVQDLSTEEFTGYALSTKQILKPDPHDLSADAFLLRLYNSYMGLETMLSLRRTQPLTAGEEKILEACQFGVDTHLTAFKGMNKYEVQMDEYTKSVLDGEVADTDLTDKILLIVSLKNDQGRIVEEWVENAKKHQVMHRAAFQQDMAETGFDAKEIDKVFAEQAAENQRNTLPLGSRAHHA
jgi:hypothetical protein